VLLTNAVEPHASDVISEAWFYVATHFLTEIWDRRCWHQKPGIFFLIFCHKMGINILGGPLRKSNLRPYGTTDVQPMYSIVRRPAIPSRPK